MSELRSALDGLRAEDLRALSDGALGDRLDEIERSVRILESERSRGLVEIERRRSYSSDGHLSAGAWLAHRQGVSRRGAEATVRRALALDQMPEVARSFADGELSSAAVEALAAAQRAAPGAFEDSERALVDAARSMGADDLRRVTDAWRAAADPELALREEDERHERRTLDLFPRPDGMTGLRGELDREDGQELIIAIRAVMDAEARSVTAPDARTPTQRRADALIQILHTFLASGDRPSVGGERPDLVVTMDLTTLEGRAGRGAELADTGEITAETARRIACDANVTRLITDARSEPLDVGRRTKVVPPALRRAVTARDRGCRFPGCGRPPGWCDCHHVRHWADGGETSLRNLILLCRPHHRAIHRGFGVEMVDGRPVFSRPTGGALTEPARLSDAAHVAGRAPP